MFRTHLRFGFVVLLAACIAGCGGSGGTTTGNTGGTGGNTGGTGGAGTSGGSTSGGGNSNSTSLTVTFNGAVLPSLVAAQIGTGAYAAQTLTGNTLTLSIPNGTTNYAVAYMCPSQGGALGVQAEGVWEGSTADGLSLPLDCSSTPMQTGNLTGSLDASAISGVSSFNVIAQNGSSITQNVFGDSITPAPVPDLAPIGNDRVLVLAFDTSSGSLLAAKNFDNQTVPGSLNGGNTVTFSTADETTPEPITYVNLPSGASTTYTAIFLEMGGAAKASVGSGITQYQELPASAIEAGDYYRFEVSVGSSAGRASAGAATSGGPVTLTFPAPWSYAGPTPAVLPSFVIDYTGFQGDANVDQTASISWNPSQYAVSVIVLTATANYQNGSTTLAIPDLSGVTGFVAPPASGTNVRWGVGIGEQSYSITNNNAPPLNSTWEGVGSNGSYTVP